MSASITRLTARALAATSMIAVSVAVGAAHAQSGETHFDIAAQPLGKALLEFNKQSGVMVMAPQDLIQGKTAPAVSGQMPPDEALARMLRDSGLKSKPTSSGVYAVTPVAAATGGDNSGAFRVAQAGRAAQDDGPTVVEDTSGNAQLEQIVVTSQRRPQLLQKVPISVTAFSSEAIKWNQIEGLQDYFKLTPNVSFSNNGNRGRNQLAVRGVGNIGGRANSFGVYVDGFNIAPTSSIRTFDPNLVSVERIEILRGPQGTFFGRNATAGAFNIVSKKPGSEFFAEAEAEYASFDSVLARGAVNVPVVDDLLAVRVSGYYEHTDGFIDNIGPAGRGSDFDAYGVLGAVRLTPNERLTIDISVRHNDYDHGTNAYVLRDPVTLGVPDGPYTIDTDREEFAQIEGQIITANIEYDFGPVTLTSITGYIDNSYREFDDRDNSPLDIQFQDVRNDLQSWSQEIQLSTSFNDQVELIAGAIYADDDVSARSIRQRGADAGGTNILDFDQREESTTWAIFADAVWHALPRLDVTIGGRFTDSDYTRTDNNILLGSVTVNPGQSVNDTDFSPRFVLTYQWTDAVLTYASASKGFKMGGASGIVPPGASPTFGKETIWNYEIGAKARLLDNRLQVNAAGFYMDWKDLQAFAFDNPDDLIFFVQNAAEASTKGFEIEASAVPIDGVDLTFGAGYLDAQYDAFENARVGGVITDLGGFGLPFAPKWTVNATGQYTRPIGDHLDGFARVEWSYIGDTFRNFDSQYLFQVNGDRTFLIPSYNVVNLRIGVEHKNFRIVGFAENLFDETYFTGIRGTTLVDPHPRVFGVRVTVNTN